MMRIVVRLEVTTDWGESRQLDVENIDRPACQLQAGGVGLSLKDGKRLLERLQQAIVRIQAYEFSELHRACTRSQRWNPVKDYRQRKVDTVAALCAAWARGS